MRIPGATSTLRKTVNCRVNVEQRGVVNFRVPNVLGALTLIGGAYLEDSRDSARHLEDAVVLLDTVMVATECVPSSPSRSWLIVQPLQTSGRNGLMSTPVPHLLLASGQTTSI